MTPPVVVAAVGVVDEIGIAGSSGVRVSWGDLGIAAPGDGRTFRAAFGRSDETFRRLDVASRTLVLACEALALPAVLAPDRRDETALVVETTAGCLDADLQFAASLAAAMHDAPIFPYTLPSTCLGEVALRHGLRGISTCLSVAPASRGAALAEATRLLTNDEAPAVVVASVDVLVRPDAPAPRECRAVAALLTTSASGSRAVAIAPLAWSSLLEAAR